MSTFAFYSVMGIIWLTPLVMIGAWILHDRRQVRRERERAARLRLRAAAARHARDGWGVPVGRRRPFSVVRDERGEDVA